MAVDGIVLLSGGLDSMVMAYQLAREGKKVRMLYLDFEKAPTQMEIASVKQTALELNAPLEIVELHGIVKMQLGYESLSRINAELDTGGPNPVDPDPVGPFVVPLSVADYYASLVDIPDLYVAVIKSQLDNRPGLRKFFQDWPRTIQLLRNTTTLTATPTVYHTPFIDMSKAEVIRLGATLNVPMKHSWTCHDNGPRHCGNCPGCDERRQGFTDSGIADPTVYRQ